MAAVSPAPTFLFGQSLFRGGIAIFLGLGISQWAGAAMALEPIRKSAGESKVSESHKMAPPRRTARNVKKPVQRKKSVDPAGYRSTERASLPTSASFGSSGTDDCWEQLQAARRPVQVLRVSEACEANHPGGEFAGEMRKLANGAGKVLEIQQAVGLSGDFFEDPVGNPAYRLNLDKAARGDKDAAYLVAIAYRVGTSGVTSNLRRMEQWLHISAGLGNGLASWELAEYYNYGGRVADAARFEKRALELGYKPAFRLPTRGY
ncbi:MAG: sel1 repeat family protein [Rhodocyclales bacterium]|nr:sel1 repeat family protein [Rhodocyclales bacterium]